MTDRTWYRAVAETDAYGRGDDSSRTGPRYRGKLQAQFDADRKTAEGVRAVVVEEPLPDDLDELFSDADAEDESDTDDSDSDGSGEDADSDDVTGVTESND